ncbi:rab effector MyRIP-like isoform X2 [Melanotaenia boesemani]|uniref:rab effector MyRIP-like isoform X2 n=1 Tax=Melanotaenia boesemani TaxID=1250792 RepID=UPI001C0401D4|nr:rab effector MyRIP-like isoform X2 [Melanotaenia boesemani]
MDRKLDLTGLSDNEAAHVLQVVQRDMRLRKKEEERLSELKQELDEEGSRCLLLSRQTCFNQRCCIRCCSPFTFLLNPKRRCRDCSYNVCKSCRVYNKRDKAWLCSACQKSRLLKTQSLEWFYTNVKRRFKRFGSAKVLKTLYRKHLAEHSALSELTEGSAYEESICNEGSICGSDSTFYKQTEEHSMAETLSVAMRVAEEAIDEAISKAEFDTSTQEKQNEAHYLRENRGELIEELAKTIVQKIISRRKTLAEMRAEYDHDWSLERNTDCHHQSACDQTSSSLKHQPNLWRSHSAFTLLDDDDNPPALIQDSPLALKKEAAGSAVTAWKSVDRLDNSVLKSPDGNWIALQSAQLSRPSLLTKRKSLVYSALERESGAVSAYEGLGSDNESKQEPDSTWGAVLQEIHRKMTDSNFNLPERTSPHMDHEGSRENLFSDTEANLKTNKQILALLKRKVPAEMRKPSSSRRTSIIDMNFNLKGVGEEEEEVKVASKPDVGKVRKSRKKKKSTKAATSLSPVSDLNKKDLHPSDSMSPEGGTTPEPLDSDGDITGNGANQINEELTLKLHQLTGRAPDSWMREEELDIERDGGDDGEGEEKRQGSKDRDDEDERLFKMDIDLEGGITKDEEETEKDDEEMKYRLYRLVAQSNLTYFSSTEDELDRLGKSEGELDKYKDKNTEKDDEEQEEKTELLTYRLCQLEKEVRLTQFSSTEDELDRGEEEEDEDLAVKVCRLVNQVSATQFSSTEDELDRMGRVEDGEDTGDEMLWKLQPEKSRLRDLASLVSASQFSSTEDELDRVGENEVNEEEIGGCSAIEKMWEGIESMEDIDMKMFDLKDEAEARKVRSDEKVTSKNVLESRGKGRDAEHHETVVEENRGFIDKRVAEDLTTANEQSCDKVEISQAKKEKEAEERREIQLETRVEAKGREEIRASYEKKGEQQNEPKASRPDEEEKFLKESLETQRRWGTTADSEEEDDTEFDRIISSMLMMTLEDMQVETVKEKAGDNRERNREMKNNSPRGETGIQEMTVDAQITDASEETDKVSHEGIKGETCGKQEDGDITDTNENVQEEKSPEMVISETPETNEIQLTCSETGVFDEGKRDMTEKWENVETQRDTAGFQKTDVGEKYEKTEENADDLEQSCTSTPQEGFLSPEQIHNGRDVELYQTIDLISSLLQQRYSAVSLRSITTEVLKVLNATEELLQGVEGEADARPSSFSLPPNMDPKKLDQQFCKLEENVYVAAGSVYSLEAELSDLEECARGICSSTSDMELSFLEEQVAAAAAKVHQSELQICDISARIAALKSAGLNVDPQSRFAKTKTHPDTFVTLDSSKQQRRRLPAPPVKGSSMSQF